jgi:uncharacterized protein (TIGR03067 family)
LAVVFALVATWAVAQTASVVVKQELEAQQGAWVTTSSIHEGEPAPAELVKTITRIVDGDKVVWERNGKRFAGTRIELGANAKHKTLDVIPDGGPKRGERVLGIYKFDGETLIICMARSGDPRPTELKADKGSHRTLQTFRRAKPADRSGTEER